MQCECVQPGFTGKSGGGDGKIARGTYTVRNGVLNNTPLFGQKLQGC